MNPYIAQFEEEIKQLREELSQLKAEREALLEAIREMGNEVRSESGFRNEYQDWDKFFEIYNAALAEKGTQ